MKKYEVEPYKVNIVHWENERMKYRYISGKSRLQKSTEHLDAEVLNFYVFRFVSVHRTSVFKNNDDNFS